MLSAQGTDWDRTPYAFKLVFTLVPLFKHIQCCKQLIKQMDINVFFEVKYLNNLGSLFQFRREEDAEKAVNDLNNRWFGGRPVYAELSPVTDFREACCRQYEMGECTRSGFCNFMHLKPISRELRR